MDRRPRWPQKGVESVGRERKLASRVRLLQRGGYGGSAGELALQMGMGCGLTGRHRQEGTGGVGEYPQEPLQWAPETQQVILGRLATRECGYS